MRLETARLVAKTYLNPHVLQCDFRCKRLIQAHPGQYVLIKIGDHWRPFSIAEVSGGHTFSIVIQLVKHTITADFFLEFEVNELIEIQEPQGIVHLPKDHNVVFSATGTGIVPLFTVAKHLLETGYSHDITILFGVRSEARLFYMDKLQKLAHDFPQCRLTIIASQPNDDWIGERGRVGDYIISHHNDFRDADFYLCGRKETVASLVEQLESINIAPHRINLIE